MILTCPSCGTQYAVKDGAIPPAGRQVRCASCKHAWHQDPEGGATPADASATPLAQEPASEERAETAPPAQEGIADPAFDAPPRQEETPAGPAVYPPIDPVAPPGEPLVEDAPPAPMPEQGPMPEQPLVEEQSNGQWSPPVDEQRREPEAPPSYDDDFTFAMDDDEEERRRSPLLTLLLIALVIAALAAAFWFLAPAEWKERVGIAAASETPLQLMMTHSDRQPLESGNELLAVSGRVINPTDEQQNVPPIRAQLRSSSGKLVYSWTIPPPARTLPPGASATFNSAEVNVPSGGDELTITLGSAKT